MKIKFLDGQLIGTRAYGPGDVDDLPDARAVVLLNGRHAIPAPEPEPEAAVAPLPAETATAPRRKRG